MKDDLEKILEGIKDGKYEIPIDPKGVRALKAIEDRISKRVDELSVITGKLKAKLEELKLEQITQDQVRKIFEKTNEKSVISINDRIDDECKYLLGEIKKLEEGFGVLKGILLEIENLKGRKIPKPIDPELLKKLEKLSKEDFNEIIQKQIKDWTPRLFRGLGMGLQSQIDTLDAKIVSESIWNRTGTVITTQVSGDSVTLGGNLAIGANNLTMTGSIADTTNRVTKGWFTDLEVTNAIAGSITGTATNLSGTPDLPDGTTATTQGALDNSTKLATTAYADSAVGASVHNATQLRGVDITAVAPSSGNEILRYNFVADEYQLQNFDHNDLDNLVSDDHSQYILVAGTRGFTGNQDFGTNDITGVGSLGVTGARLTKGWFTDLESTNAIVADITGNAATVTGFTPASGSLTLSGADALTLTTTAATNVTLPTTGTLATTTELHDAVTIGTANGLSLSTQALSLATADTDTIGALTDTDWDTFNDKAEANQTFYIGTTQVAINRASAALTLAGLTLTTPDIGTPSAGILTNCTFPTLNQNTTGNAATVTNATFTTALTVNTGALTLTAAGTNDSVLTIGAGASSISGSNTGDEDLSGYALVDQTMYIGTTGVAINRGTAALTLAGITLTTPDIGTPSAGVLTNATGLPYTGIANGTDGELITWSAAGVADTVAVGTATHVLTSNGPGVAPTFQAASGGANTALSNLASVAINTSLLSDTADTDDLGSATKEWRSLYIGDAGKIYLGLGQDTSIERSAADEMTLVAGGEDALKLTSTKVTAMEVGAYSFDLLGVEEPGAPGLVLAAGGTNLGIGKYYYYYTYYTADGSTGLSSGTASITTDAANRKVTVTLAVSTDDRVIGRKLYRTEVGGLSYHVYLLDTIADNTTTVYVDDIADASLGADNVYWKENSTIDYITYNGSSILMAGTAGREPGTFLGALAGATTVAGTAIGGSNTGIGWSALQDVTTAAKCTAVGYGASMENTTGGNNTSVGHLAAGYNTEGANNICVGRNTNLYNLAGNNNTIIGNYASVGASNQSHSYNTIVGSYAGYASTTGGRNSSVGYESLRSITSGEYNVAIGYRAGYASTTTSYGISIGAYAGLYETGAEKLLIGNRDYSSEAAARTNSIIYGVMSSTVADQELTVNAKSYLKNDVAVTGNVTMDGLIIPSGTTPLPAIEGSLFLDTDDGTNGTLKIYSNGGWRTIQAL